MRAGAISVHAVDITSWGGAFHQSHSTEFKGLNNNSPKFLKQIHFFAANADFVPRFFDAEDKTPRIPLDTYRIGYWHWETSKMPLTYGKFANFYNELWVPSQYVAESILSTPTISKEVKVFVMPYTFDVAPKYSLKSRPCVRLSLASLLQSFSEHSFSSATISASVHYSEGLSSAAAHELIADTSTTIFLSIFDFNSGYDRKNIDGVIRAFARAFKDEQVAIIIKTINSVYWPSDANRFQSMIGRIPNVVIVDGVLPVAELLLIKSACDCFVSLHRSEGWGLNLLDAVLGGQPVISTAFGGSEEFMRPLYESNGLIDLRVSYSIINISNNFGPYSTDMSWAEPDHGAAVHAMRQIHFRLNHYQLRAGFARRDALKMLSAETVGGKMQRRLAEITNCLCLSLYSHIRNFSVCSRAEQVAESPDAAYCEGVVLGQSLEPISSI